MSGELNFKKLIAVSSMLFGMFFGAGNLIFPAHMGQASGYNVWYALLGFIVTGAGLPLLGVVALGISRSDGLLELSKKAGRFYGTIFTCVLYLTIGPFFAIPRCATVSFATGVSPLLGSTAGSVLPAVFSFVFFGVVLWFSLFPNGILTWIGKIINPVFLIFLGFLVITALINPIGRISQAIPQAQYQKGAFFEGLLSGYNTMDALAALAFGIVVVNAIHGLGIHRAGEVAKSTVKAGILSCFFMAVIYAAVAIAGAQSRGMFPVYSNGGEALAAIANHYFGKAGTFILAITVTLACLKTAIGLITSCCETFEKIFTKGPSYRLWTIIFSLVSFLISNFSLNTIIKYSQPVLMLLYPLSITLILLTIFGKTFNNHRAVYISVTSFTFAAAVFDFFRAFPENPLYSPYLNILTRFASRTLPLFDLGLGWVIPAVTGFVVGIIIKASTRCKRHTLK